MTWLPSLALGVVGWLATKPFDHAYDRWAVRYELRLPGAKEVVFEDLSPEEARAFYVPIMRFLPVGYKLPVVGNPYRSYVRRNWKLIRRKRDWRNGREFRKLSEYR